MSFNSTLGNTSTGMGTPAEWHNSSRRGMDFSASLRGTSTGNRSHAASVDENTRTLAAVSFDTVNYELQSKLQALQALMAKLSKTHADGIPVLKKLDDTKTLAEAEIADKTNLHKINQKRKAIRMKRPSQENVYDPAQEKLDEEDHILQNSITALKACHSDVCTMIAKLTDAQNIVKADLNDKTHAEGLERNCIGPQSVNRTPVKIEPFGPPGSHLSSSISYSDHKAQIRDGSAKEIPQSWEAKTEMNIAHDKETQAAAMHLCQDVEATVKKCQAEIDKAHQAVHTAMIAKINYSCDVWKDLWSHKEETEKEIANCIQTKKDLEKAIADKTVPLNTSKTRYDIRSQRTQRELVNDGTHIALKAELTNISQILEDLNVKLQETIQMLAHNNKTRDDLIADIELKVEAINLDSDCFVFPRAKDARHTAFSHMKPFTMALDPAPPTSTFVRGKFPF